MIRRPFRGKNGGSRAIFLGKSSFSFSFLFSPRLHRVRSESPAKPPVQPSPPRPSTPLCRARRRRSSRRRSSSSTTRDAPPIPMRDGVKLHTVILVPREAKGAPILLTRTPYDADKLTTATKARTSARLWTRTPGRRSSKAGTSGWRRSMHGPEGDYLMNRPVHGPQNPTPSTARPTRGTRSTGS